MNSIRLSFIILFWTVSAWAQSDTPPAPPKFPYEASNAIVRFDCTYVKLNLDGTAVKTSHYRIALLTDRAIRQYAQDVSVYNIGYDTVEVLSAKVHDPSGKVIDVDSTSIVDVPLPAFGKFFLNNVREKIVTFPELTRGSEIEVVLRETTHEPPMDGEFNLTEYFEHSDPIQTRRVVIEAPESIEMIWKAGNGSIPYSKSTKKGMTRHVWEAANIQQMVPEPGMPPSPEVANQLFVTTIDDWQTWSKWYHELAEPEMVADSSIKAEVAQLTIGKNRDQKIHSIFDFVSNRIRYVDTALTGRKAGYKPESAAVTYRNKYGVCRDKAALMVTMLREAGIESNITLMNPSWKIEGDIPADQFNHAIVAVPQGDSLMYVDPTVEKTADYLAANEQDRAVLVCTENGDDLRWTKLEPSEKNLYEIHAQGTIDSTGTLQSEVTISAKGLPDLVLRSHLQSQSPEENENLFKTLIQRISSNARMNSLEISHLEDLDEPVVIRLSYTAEQFSIPAGKYLLFQIPGQSQGLDFLTNWLLYGSDMTERRYDLRLSSTFAVRVDESISYPKGWTVRSLPEKVDLDFGDFRMARDFEAAKNEVRVRRILDFSTLDIPLSRYSELRQLVKKSDSMSRGKVILVRA